jgi:hypothetical protein
MITPESIAAAGSEAAHQTALFCAISQHEIKAKYPELALAFHVPNGGARDKRTAASLKAQGVKAGVWDIFLPVPGGAFKNGLWLELKVKPNKLTPEQQDFYYAMQPYNYDWLVAYTWREAFDKLISYLGDR